MGYTRRFVFQVSLSGDQMYGCTPFRKLVKAVCFPDRSLSRVSKQRGQVLCRRLRVYSSQLGLKDPVSLRSPDVNYRP